MTESIRDRKRPVRGRQKTPIGPLKGFGPPLSEHERAELKAWIDRAEPLPERLRGTVARLFAGPEAPRLIWAGKHDPPRVLARPLVLRERYGRGERPGAWRDLLIHGDNGAALAALAEEPYRALIRGVGGLKLIYIDPPFAAQQDFAVTLAFGDQPGPASRVRYPAYGDCWEGQGEAYLSLMQARLRAMHGLLADDGFLFLHCDWRSHAALRLILDEIFGRAAFINEIVWHYYNKYSHGQRCLPRSHDTILLYAKDAARAGKLNALRLPRERPARQLVRENVNGVLRNARDAEGRLRYREASDRKLSDVWEIPQLQPASGHWSGFPTQKHPDLLARILALCTREGDLVADFFAGAGTLPVVAQLLGRRWIACDAAPVAIHTARKRLLKPPAAGPAGAAPPSFDLLDVDENEGLPLETQGLSSLAAQARLGPEGLRVSLDGFIPAPLDPPALQHRRAARAFDVLSIERGRLVRRKAGRAGQGDSAEILTRDWSDWIDFWAVGWTPPESPRAIAPQWLAMRPSKSRAGSRRLVLESPPLALPPDVSHVAVLAVDPFGRTTAIRVPVERD